MSFVLNATTIASSTIESISTKTKNLDMFFSKTSSNIISSKSPVPLTTILISTPTTKTTLIKTTLNAIISSLTTATSKTFASTIASSTTATFTTINLDMLIPNSTPISFTRWNSPYHISSPNELPNKYSRIQPKKLIEQAVKNLSTVFSAKSFINNWLVNAGLISFLILMLLIIK